MKSLKLITKSISGVGTFGELYDGNMVVCVTVEQPWNNNEPFKSCVPAGLYKVRRHTSPSKGDCFIMTNESVGIVETGGLRDKCLWHVANFPSDVKGCAGPGDKFMPESGRWGVSNSRKTLDMLKQKYPDGWDMEIVRL